MFKKCLLTLSVMALGVSVAQAETFVQLYGIADAGYGYTATKVKIGDTSTRTTNVGAQSGHRQGSRWGMQGTEDLGNGTRAIFQLESGFSLGNGSQSEKGVLFDRKAYVGLSGDSWGTFTIGHQTNVGDDFVAGMDPFGTDWSMSSATTVLGDSLTRNVAGSIKYLSPDFSGFKFGILVANEQNTTKINSSSSRKSDRYLSLGLAYDVEPLSIAANIDTNRIKVSGADPFRSTAWNLGVAYDFEVLKLHLLYGQTKGFHETFSDSELAYKALNAGVVPAGFASKNTRRQAWVAGISAPLGDNSHVMFSYQGSTVKNDDFSKRAKTTGFGLAYEYGLSKRTHAYIGGFYGHTKYDKNKYQATQVYTGLTHAF